MDIGSVFLIAALFVLVGLYVAKPIIDRQSSSVGVTERMISSLLAERDRVLDALQELDFDNQLGKIPEEDYPPRRADLLQRGAETLRQIDAYQKDAKSDEADTLEAAIAARRAALPSDGGSALSEVEPDDMLEAQIAARRRDRREKAGGFCPGCGQPIQQSDRFCAKCGTAQT